MILSLLCVPAVYAQETASVRDTASVRHHIAQARQFVKNQWYADAALEIEAALALPDGAGNFDVNWLGAQIYYELVRVDRALPLAERAAAVAVQPLAREQAEAFAELLRSTFGFLSVHGPYEGLTSRLQIERTSVLFDADLKQLINKLSLHLRERTPLPTRIALPDGEYLINGVAVTVTAGQDTVLPLDMGELGARGLAALQVTRLEISGGTSVLFGERVENLRPGGALDLSLTQPIGPLLIGVVGAYDIRDYTAGASRTASSPTAVSGGLRVGREFVLGGPLGVRPSIGVRYGLVPGIGFACHSADNSYTCVPIGEAPGEIEIYAVGRSFAPFAELSVEYREAGRTTALGMGVKAVVEQHIGSVASPGGAAIAAQPDADPLAYEAEASTWSATGIRLQANLSFAF